MKVLWCCFFVVIPVFLISWLCTYLYDCYLYLPRRSNEQEPSPRDGGHLWPGETAENIFWFIQISDIHLSLEGDPQQTRKKDLITFCKSTIPLVDPSFVLVTGDLTDAKFSDQIRSQQFKDEWLMYSEILTSSGVLEKYKWLDLRGNHDNFDVQSHNPEVDFYRTYAQKWQQHHETDSDSYIYIHQTQFGRYSFIGLDACLHPGPRRPYNFFGAIHDEDYVGLKRLLSEAGSVNHTIWFAHYPTTTIVTNHHYLRDLLHTSTAYICGHLHELGGMIYQMYGRHLDGHLELELMDWKYNRKYRIMAIDHDLVSFVDTSFGQWPVILITNPKDARFNVPKREPIERIKMSSHIRMLIFSPSEIQLVKVYIDGRLLDGVAKQVVTAYPLYVLPWEPVKLQPGAHTITVFAEDSEGHSRSVSHRFSLEGTVYHLDIVPTLLLLSNLTSLFRLLFITIWLSILVALLAAVLSSTKKGWATNVVYHNISRHSEFYIPLTIHLMHFGIGPWYMGELITGVYGWVFPHGLYVGGHVIQESITYVHGIGFLTFVTLPLVACLNKRLSPSHKDRHFPGKVALSLGVVLPLLLSLRLMWTSCYGPYGLLSVVVSPGMSWPILMYSCLVVRAFFFK